MPCAFFKTAHFTRCLGDGSAHLPAEFFSDVLFGGALTPAERQAAIDYLNTDDLGVPTPYDNDRIRETVGVMLGYPQFEEQ